MLDAAVDSGMDGGGGAERVRAAVGVAGIARGQGMSAAAAVARAAERLRDRSNAAVG